MVDVNKAYVIALSKYPFQYSPMVTETDNLYIFYPRPNSIKPTVAYNSGTVFPAVEKRTGKFVKFDIIEDEMLNPKAYRLNIT